MGLTRGAFTAPTVLAEGPTPARRVTYLLVHAGDLALARHMVFPGNYLLGRSSVGEIH